MPRSRGACWTGWRTSTNRRSSIVGLDLPGAAAFANLGLLVEVPEHYWADFNITPYAAGGFVLDILHQVLGAAPLGTEEERPHYLHLLGEYGQTIG